MLDRPSLAGQTFLDIGCGSGLFSLVARRLGAKVVSFDFDADTVACTKALRDRYRPADEGWTIRQGSILDGKLLAELGTFDVVYSWGALHHTGDLAQALRNAASLTAADGAFVFSLYRRTPLCWLWKIEKRIYCVAPEFYKAAIRKAFTWLLDRRTGTSSDYAADNRGMDRQRDIHDWLGGYPYESIRPEQVDRAMNTFGFTRLRANITPPGYGVLGTGCDEFVYGRAGCIAS